MTDWPLEPGERLLWQGQPRRGVTLFDPSPLDRWTWFFFGLVGVVLVGFALFHPTFDVRLGTGMVACAVVVVVLLVQSGRCDARRLQRFALTDRRVMAHGPHGGLSELPLDKARHVALVPGGFGTLVVSDRPFDPADWNRPTQMSRGEHTFPMVKAVVFEGLGAMGSDIETDPVELRNRIIAARAALSEQAVPHG